MIVRKSSGILIFSLKIFFRFLLTWESTFLTIGVIKNILCPTMSKPIAHMTNSVAQQMR
jgi:hypothetical protein